MKRCYLSYRLILKEPLIISDGSQLGNVLLTQDFIPGSSILGLCAGLYLRRGNGAKENGSYTKEFRSLFLSDDVIFSPAYPLAYGSKKTFPMPMSVLGCKYYGFRNRGGRFHQMHGFKDYLLNPVDAVCSAEGCGAPMEHKTGYCYYDSREGEFFDYSVRKDIFSHNRVDEKDKDKSLFSFEAIQAGEQFYGEIAFREESNRNTIKYLLQGTGKLGKARNRGYGLVEIHDVIEREESFKKEWAGNSINGTFSIFIFSNTILVDRGLRYVTFPDKETLAFRLGLTKPEDIEIINSTSDTPFSFFKSCPVLGFNQTRRMPLPLEQAILRGSVFSVKYNGGEGIAGRLQDLQEEGMGLRRNEGLGQVIINHKIHSPDVFNGEEVEA